LKIRRVSHFAFVIFSAFFAPGSAAQAPKDTTHQTQEPEQQPNASNYEEISTERKLKNEAAQISRYKSFLDYAPPSLVKVPKSKLEVTLQKIAKSSTETSDPYSLKDISDATHERHTRFKVELEQQGIDLEKSSSSILMKFYDQEAKWSSHAAAVIYTDKGPMVFDPDVKDLDQRLSANLITPLDTWLNVDWSHGDAIFVLAPPSFSDIEDFNNPQLLFEKLDPKKNRNKDFWLNFDGKVPSDVLFKNLKFLSKNGKPSSENPIKITQTKLGRFQRQTQGNFSCQCSELIQSAKSSDIHFSCDQSRLMFHLQADHKEFIQLKARLIDACESTKKQAKNPKSLKFTIDEKTQSIRELSLF